MTRLDPAIAAGLHRVLGHEARITAHEPLSGGSINATSRIRTTAGTFVLKANPSAPPGFFESEAAGLDALRASGTPLKIPQVMGWSAEPPQWLLLEDLDSTSSPLGPAAFDERLGQGLAALHRATAPAYGFAADNYCGLTPQANPWTPHWVDFYARSRLGRQLSMASGRDVLGAADLRAIDDLIARLPDWIGDPVEGPALIHGDLWSGNLHRDRSGAPALIDPAVSYSHREAELGMMLLFGGFGPRVLAAYHEAFPLEPGWRDRHPLYQLYHLLNHVNLFGRAYVGQTMAIVRRFV